MWHRALRKLTRPKKFAPLGLVRQAARTESMLQHELAAHARSLEQRVAQETSDVARKTGEISLLSHQMRAAEEFFENLIESSVDAIVTVRAGRITFVSQGGQRMFGHGTPTWSACPWKSGSLLGSGHCAVTRPQGAPEKNEVMRRGRRSPLNSASRSTAAG